MLEIFGSWLLLIVDSNQFLLTFFQRFPSVSSFFYWDLHSLELYRPLTSPSPPLPFNFCEEPFTEEDVISNLPLEISDLTVATWVFCFSSPDCRFSWIPAVNPSILRFRNATYHWSHQCLFRYHPSSLLIFLSHFFSNLPRMNANTNLIGIQAQKI